MRSGCWREPEEKGDGGQGGRQRGVERPGRQVYRERPGRPQELQWKISNGSPRGVTHRAEQKNKAQG